jgi:DNA-binding response OmpR family regulator
MTMDPTTATAPGPRPGDGRPDAVLREARQRFIAGFPKRCDSIDLLIKTILARGPRGLTAPLREISHQIAGMAGTVGFPAVSERAGEIEVLATRTEHGFDLQAARQLVEQLHQAFADDLASPPAWAMGLPAGPPEGQRILVVDDAEDQRQVVSDSLKAAGYQPVGVATGDVVLKTAKEEQPALILLDANLPGLDGYSVCRLLKSDPELAAVPVVFMTVRAGLDDKLAGLTLGADEYLVKPLHMPELLLRVDLLLRRARGARTLADQRPASRQGQLLNYDVFVRVGREQLRATPATFALIRVPDKEADEVIAILRGCVRSRDIVSRYDLNHVVMLLAGAPPALVRHRVADQIESMKARGIRGVWAGLSYGTAPGEKPIEVLLAEADDALAEARYLGESAALKADHPRAAGASAAATKIVLAEDDPEVVRIVETQFAAGGYTLLVAADGEETMDAVRAHSPDVLVLDLVMPKLTGFEVLEQLRASQGRPRVVILSARGREEDVTRAFELGADDYVTKPFSPKELMARVARLLR